MCDSEQAKAYTELAKEKFDGIWRRRQITWRTNFVLWAGLAALSVGLYREAGDLPEGTWIWTLIAFAVVFVTHTWHWVGAYVSDEIGYSWAHYFQQQAEINLGEKVPDKERLERPRRSHGWWFHLWEKHPSSLMALRKAHAVIPQILVTAALMTVTLFLLYKKMPVENTTGSTTKPAMAQAVISAPVNGGY